jgi:hypothetical protein
VHPHCLGRQGGFNIDPHVFGETIIETLKIHNLFI